MTKIINIIFLLTLITFINPEAIAETKRDCSQYSTKTFAGLAKKMRCKKGLEPRKKSFFDEYGQSGWLRFKNWSGGPQKSPIRI